MKSFFKIFIPILVLGAVAYHFRVPLEAKIVPAWNYAKAVLFPRNPCEEPIPYLLGTFDAKFGISKDYFLGALKDAEAIWEKSYGKELFTYSPENEDADALKVNLIYDYRQQATSKLNNLGIAVENTRASYDALKAKFTALKSEYETELNNFNKEVKAFNQSNRADKATYDRLQKEQKNLNAKADEINAMVVVLNKMAGALNLTVENYNNINVARGESFEEGVYESDGINQEIDIYEFSSRQKLVRVLAHELGHALGLDHVEDSKAIMYKLNQGTSMALTAADLKALKDKCEVK